MSRMNLLLDVVSDLRSLADSLQVVADAAVQDGPERPGQNPEEQPVQEPEKKNAAKETEPPAEETKVLEPVLPMSDVPAALS